MTTDITELAHGKSLRKKLNRRMNDAYGFQRTSGGKHTTISLSINECKSIIAAMDERLALVEALEKAQQRITELEQKHCGGALMERELAHSEVINKLMSEIDNRDSRIAELEARSITVKFPTPKDEAAGWKIDPEFIGKIQDAIGHDDECQCCEGTPSMEIVEAVLLAADFIVGAE